MFRVIVTEMSTGAVREIRDIIPGAALLDAMDNVGRDCWDHVRVTLWCEENGNMGSREYNSPFGGYDRQRVLTWACGPEGVMPLITDRRKIQAIKRLREAWPLLRLKTAKELVEEITPFEYRY